MAANSLSASFAGVNYLLGTAHLALLEFGLAEQAFSTCIALHPDFPLIQQALMHQALARVRGTASHHSKSNYENRCSDYAGCVSIIICSIKSEQFARVSANYHELMSGVTHEIIGIHDARSLCEGYNRGIRQSKGDILIFSHDDIEIVTPDFAARLLSYLDQYDLIGIAGTTRLMGPAWIYAGWPHVHGQVGFINSLTGQLMVQGYDMRGKCSPNAQAMDGVFLAARREVAERIGFDQSTFDGWHLYDVDFTFSAYLAGYRTAICHDLCVIHDSRGEWGEDWQHYARAFMTKHGDNLLRVVNPEVGELCSIAVESRTEWLLMTQILTQAVNAGWS